MGNVPHDMQSPLPPIDLGGVRLDTPVILAPMSGVTDLPFRRAAARLQEIEGNPLDAADFAMFEMFEREDFDSALAAG